MRTGYRYARNRALARYYSDVSNYADFAWRWPWSRGEVAAPVAEVADAVATPWWRRAFDAVDQRAMALGRGVYGAPGYVANQAQAAGNAALNQAQRAGSAIGGFLGSNAGARLLGYGTAGLGLTGAGALGYLGYKTLLGKRRPENAEAPPAY